MSGRNRKNASRLDAFDDKTELENVADEIFGGSKAPEFNTGRVVARPIDLTEIRADVRQPRRVIPASIRLVWDGGHADVPRLLDTWASIAANAAGRTIDIGQIIAGEGEGTDTDGTPAIYESFISLCRLAGSILRDGLINPITIIDERDHHLIESGERRWLAYWLLHLHTQNGEEFSRIPAVTVSGADYVWRQAAENTARRNLNAVGMARQLALLVMAARGAGNYADYEQIVHPGQSDRLFYAQVADGNTHRIPKGAAERIQAAMGLSKDMLSHYRDILRVTDDEQINDALWMHGDIGDWPETAFRDANRLTLVNLRQIVSRADWSYADFRAAATLPIGNLQPPPLPTPAALPPVGTRAISPPPAVRENAAEAEQVLAALTQAFHRTYALEVNPNPAAQTIARRATIQLNQAQTSYDSGHYDTARTFINTASRILSEPVPTESVSEAAQVDEPAGMSDYAIKELILWAWRWGKGHLEGGGWFTSQDIHNVEPGDLGLLVLRNYLQQGTTQKGNKQIVRYRIAPLGCRYLGKDFDMPEWDVQNQQPTASDNPVSTGSDKPLLKPGDSLFHILAGIRNLAHSTNHMDAENAANDLMELTRNKVNELVENGHLNDALQFYAGSINAAFMDWSQVIGVMLDDLLNE